MDTTYKVNRSDNSIVCAWEPQPGHLNEVKFVGYLETYTNFTTSSKPEEEIHAGSENSYYVNALISAFVSFIESPWGSAILSEPLNIPYSNIDEVESVLYDSNISLPGGVFYATTTLPTA